MKFVLSRKQWESMGKKAKWMDKNAELIDVSPYRNAMEAVVCRRCRMYATIPRGQNIEDKSKWIWKPYYKMDAEERAGVDWMGKYFHQGVVDR